MRSPVSHDHAGSQLPWFPSSAWEPRATPRSRPETRLWAKSTLENKSAFEPTEVLGLLLVERLRPLLSGFDVSRFEERCPVVILFTFTQPARLVEPQPAHPLQVICRPLVCQC